MANWRSSLAVVAAILVAGFLILWWSYGDLSYYVSQLTQGSGSQTKPPSNAALPVSGKLVSQTSTRLILSVAGGATQAYSIFPSTTVASQVDDGEIGKYLSELPAGTLLLVHAQDLPGNPVSRVVVLPPAADSPAIALAGILTQKAAGEIMVSVAGGPDKKVLVDHYTTVRSTVVSGVKGKALSELPIGSKVQIVGTQTSLDGTLKAEMIILL